jgi:Ca2+:H+ antiporter
MDLAIGIAIGSSMQVALLLLPFVVILGWIIDQPMSLHFQPFETIVLFISTYLAYMVVQDGRSNYLEGAMLLGIYVMISLLFFLCPDSGLVASP